MTDTNAYCRALGIPVPRLEEVRKSPDANYYSLLLAALLEHGEPMTLEQAAQRFEQAGIAPRAAALASLKRCKPGRPPIYRDGDLYALDPHDDETAFWAFRLGLKPAMAPAVKLVRPDPGPLPAPDQPLTRELLAEAWRHGIPGDWSSQRLAICVLDAHGGSMLVTEVMAYMATGEMPTRLTAGSAQYWRSNAAITAGAGGRWVLDPLHPSVASARQAIRKRLEVARRWWVDRPEPAVVRATSEFIKRQGRANGERLGRMRRVILHAYPPRAPRVVVLLDVNQKTLVSYLDEQVAEVRAALQEYEMIAAIDVRPLVRTLDFEPGDRRLHELGPPQKTIRLDSRGRTLKITVPLLISSSCHISRPLADDRVLDRYLSTGQTAPLRRRLESEARNLFAYYQYGRLHGAVRVRGGFLDEMIPAPWVHPDEPKLRHLVREAHAQDLPLEVRTGRFPGWDEPDRPWHRVHAIEHEWQYVLVDELGSEVAQEDVQVARLMRPGDH